MLLTVTIINISYARVINIDEAKACKDPNNYGKSILQCLL